MLEYMTACWSVLGQRSMFAIDKHVFSIISPELACLCLVQESKFAIDTTESPGRKVKICTDKLKLMEPIESNLSCGFD